MIEYCNIKLQESLVSELRKYPVDLISPNDTAIQQFFSEPALSISNEIKQLLIQHNYVIIRNFSSRANDAMTLARLMSNRLFYQGEDLKYIYQFETQPFQTEIFSSSLNCGAFHTDFWSANNTPKLPYDSMCRARPKTSFLFA